MESYPRAALERTMKIPEVILRAVAKKITWAQARDFQLARVRSVSAAIESIAQLDEVSTSG
jgi:hypothetical protein